MANTVKRTDIKNNSINSSKIASGSITSDKIAANSIQAKHLSAEAITAVQISAADINAITVAASKISADNISANSIDGSKIKAGTITSDRLDVNALSAVNASITSLDVKTVNALNLKASTAYVDQLSSTKLTATTATINDLIAVNANVTNKLTAAQVDARIVNANVITTNTLNAGVINAIQLNGEYAKIVNLNSEIARIESLTSTNISAVNSTITNLDVKFENVLLLKAGKEYVDNLFATKASIDSLTSGAITVKKVSAGAIGLNQLSSDIISSDQIVTNFLLSKNIQSKNFNGSVQNGSINIGTTGYFLDSASGTVIVNKLVARDGVIAGNYIQFNENGAFEVDPVGNLKVKMDNDTLGLTNGKLSVISVPSTAIKEVTSNLNFINGCNETIYTPMIGYGGSFLSYTQAYIDGQYKDYQKADIMMLFDSNQYLESSQNFQSGLISNLSISVDLTNVVNLAGTYKYTLNLWGYWSDSPDRLLNTDEGVGGLNYCPIADITNPVLPLIKTHLIPEFKIKKPVNPTNRYLIIYPKLFMSGGGISGTYVIKMNSSAKTQFVINANGYVPYDTLPFQNMVAHTGSKLYIV